MKIEDLMVILKIAKCRLNKLENGFSTTLDEAVELGDTFDKNYHASVIKDINYCDISKSCKDLLRKLTNHLNRISDCKNPCYSRKIDKNEIEISIKTTFDNEQYILTKIY